MRPHRTLTGRMHRLMELCQLMVYEFVAVRWIVCMRTLQRAKSAHKFRITYAIFGAFESTHSSTINIWIWLLRLPSPLLHHIHHTHTHTHLSSIIRKLANWQQIIQYLDTENRYYNNSVEWFWTLNHQFDQNQFLFLCSAKHYASSCSQHGMVLLRRICLCEGRFTTPRYIQKFAHVQCLEFDTFGIYGIFSSDQQFHQIRLHDLQWLMLLIVATEIWLM